MLLIFLVELLLHCVLLKPWPSEANLTFGSHPHHNLASKMDGGGGYLAWQQPGKDLVSVLYLPESPSDFSFVLSVPVQLPGSRLFRQLRMWVGSAWRITEDINLAGQCALALPPCCFGIYAHCLHREHGRGPPIDAIIFANADPAGLSGSRRLMTKIKVCCTSMDSINQPKLLPQSFFRISSTYVASFSACLPPNFTTQHLSPDRFQHINLKMICPALLIIDERAESGSLQ